jgi:hypothetical protein
MCPARARPQQPKLPAAFASRFGNSKAASMLAGVHATPLRGGADAIDEHARRIIVAAGNGIFSPEHFYIFDLSAVLERWRVWTTALPRVTPFYAGARLGPWIRVACVSHIGAF